MRIQWNNTSFVFTKDCGSLENNNCCYMWSFWVYVGALKLCKYCIYIYRNSSYYVLQVVFVVAHTHTHIVLYYCVSLAPPNIIRFPNNFFMNSKNFCQSEWSWKFIIIMYLVKIRKIILEKLIPKNRGARKNKCVK